MFPNLLGQKALHKLTEEDMTAAARLSIAGTPGTPLTL